jgi:hypothetical protein
MKTKGKLEKAIINLQEVKDELERSDITEKEEKKTSDSQIEAVKRSDEKRGMKAKTYKLEEILVDQFAEMCDISGLSQSAVLSMLMGNWITQGNTDEREAYIDCVEVPCSCFWCKLARVIQSRCKRG